MSEFRTAAAAVAALEARVAALQRFAAADGRVRDAADVAEAQGALEEVREALEGEVSASVERFRARCAMKDPVTQAPRFGPKMLAKVQAMVAQYDGLRGVVEEEQLLETAKSCVDKFDRSEAEREEQEVQEKLRAEMERKEKEEKQRLEIEREEQERRRREEELERKRVEELARAAQLVREQRERERLERERIEREEQQFREALNAQFTPGKESLVRALGMLQQSTGDKLTYRNTLQRLLTVISNICSSPENAALRHIPKENANFHADIGQFDGGHQSLFALGFKEIYQDEKFVFVLEVEPDLSEDLDKWSAWFDNLRDMQEFLASQADAMK